MDRRNFLTTAAAAAAAMSLPRTGSAQTFTPVPGRWRTFELVTRIELTKPDGTPRAWIPIPVVDTAWQKPGSNQWAGNAKTMEQISDPKYGSSLLYAEWNEGEKVPVVELTSRFQTQDRMQDWSQKITPPETAAMLAMWTQPTELIPTDGIVRKTANEIIKGRKTDVEQARALYDWVVENSYREPTVRGCGVGDIKVMLETGNMGGKCADLNALFVGMSRSVGIPARDVYGICVAKSAFGYKALGAGSADVTKAQHCRAEVWLKDYGWVAMDPADVAKAAREETSEFLKIDHPLIAAVRPKLFGGWEGNWVAFNTAHDVVLPNATKGGKVGFLMYPQAETAQGRRDSLDPDTFKYTITTREIPS